ncbi:MAG: ribbon-helix-helix domain-containing protein [Bacteroidota bacterium]
MSTFTSSLPDTLLQQLELVSKKLSMPKNKIIEKALKLYLDQLNRAEYVKSYRQAMEDEDILKVAEEDMAYYTKQLEEGEAG